MFQAALKIPVGILGTASVRPGKLHTTEQILARTSLQVPVEQMEQRTGVLSRYWVEGEPSSTRLAVQAVGDALQDAGMEPGDLRRLIFTSSTCGDYLFPSTSNTVLHELGISDTCHAFDLNNACMGFLLGIDAAARAVATGVGPVAVVAAEIFSPYIRPEEPRPYLVFGDGASAAVLGPPTTSDEGILGSFYGNVGAHLMSVVLRHPGITRRPESIDFSATNKEISLAAVEAFATCSQAAADQSGLAMSDIHWVVPHQPNGNMLHKIMDRLGFAMDRVVPIVSEVGNVGAASMAFGLDALRREKEISAGQYLLFTGVGAGGAYGAAVYRAGDWSR